MIRATFDHLDILNATSLEMAFRHSALVNSCVYERSKYF